MMSWEERRYFDQMVTSTTGALHAINKTLEELVDVESQRLDTERMMLHQLTSLAVSVRKIAPHSKIDIQFGDPVDSQPASNEEIKKAVEEITKSKTKKEK